MRHRIEDVARRYDEQLDRLAVPLGDRNDPREQQLLVVGEQPLFAQVAEPGVGPLQQPHRHDDDVALAGVGVVERPVQVLQRVVIAHRHQQVAGARGQLAEADVARRQHLELIEMGRLACGPPAGGRPLGEDEPGVEDQREGDAGDRGQLFREQVGGRDGEQRQRDHTQTDGQLDSADAQVPSHPPLARPWLLEAQHQHGQRLQREAPDDAERIRLAE